MKQTIAMLALPMAAIAVGLIAQTRPSIFQISGPPTGFVSVLVAKGNGTLVWARIANGLTLQENTDGTAVLVGSAPVVVTPPAPGPNGWPEYVIGEVLRFDPGTRKATLRRLPVEGTVRIYRNGIRQTEGVDYTRAGAQLNDTPYYTSAAVTYDAVASLIADYQVQP